MAATIDAVSSATPASTNSLTWAHTCNGDYIIVGSSYGNSSITGATYNGVALAQVPGALFTDNGYHGDLWGWDFANGSVPQGTHDVVVSYGSAAMAMAGAISLIGVNQSGGSSTLGTAVNNVETDFSNTSVTVSSAAGDMVIDCAMTAAGGATLTRTSSQTAGYNTGNIAGGGVNAGAGSYKAGAASVVMSYSFGGPGYGGVCAISVKAASPGSASISPSTSPSTSRSPSSSGSPSPSPSASGSP